MNIEKMILLFLGLLIVQGIIGIWANLIMLKYNKRTESGSIRTLQNNVDAFMRENKRLALQNDELSRVIREMSVTQ